MAFLLPGKDSFIAYWSYRADWILWPREVIEEYMTRDMANSQKCMIFGYR